jgi:O-antigen ligase
LKWPLLALLLAAVVPFGGWLRSNPRELPKVCVLMGFLPFGIGEFHLYMAVISWPQWAGYVKGLEISLLDILALAVYISLPSTGRALPFRLSMGLYFFAVILSVFQSPAATAAIFYVWQAGRMLLIYAVIAKASSVDERVGPALLTGMTLGLCFEACFALWERFGLGQLHAGGTLGHQNFLGLISHFVTFPYLALLLAGERGWRPVVTPIAGLLIAALTVSRATVGLVGIGYIGVFLLSVLRGWTRRKAMVLAAGVACACVLAPLVLSSFEQRLNRDPETTSYDERAALEKAAATMIADHPFGVGANYYVMAANILGYNARAGVAWTASSDSANVHNIYYLVAAETGYLGLATFSFMLLQPLIVAFRCGWRNRNDRRGDLLLGLGAALLIVYIHSYFEWIFIMFQAQYMFALNAGLVAGLATQLGYWPYRTRNRAVAAPPVGSFAKEARH